MLIYLIHIFQILPDDIPQTFTHQYRIIRITYIFLYIQLRNPDLLARQSFSDLAGLNTQYPLSTENQLRSRHLGIGLILHFDRPSLTETHLIPEIRTVIQLTVNLRQSLRHRLTHFLPVKINVLSGRLQLLIMLHCILDCFFQ